MEFVEGDTLTTWLKRYPRTWREILDVFLQAARGLVAAHAVGLLHRDFKPDNVLVGGDGRVRVTDFGLARSLVAHLDEESGRGVTPLAAVRAQRRADRDRAPCSARRATWRPSSCTGPDIDARADQFSFCVALYEALYGEHPLPGSTSVSMLEKGDQALPPPEGTRSRRRSAARSLRGLERDRAKRFPTMAALMSELIPPPPRVSPRVVALALGGVVLVGGAAAAVIATKDDVVAPGPGDDTTSVLIEKINELKLQITMLDKERRELILALEKLAVTQDDVVTLQRQLVDKDKQIQSLVQQVTVLQTGIAGRTVRAASTPSQSALVREAIALAHPSIDNCLDEWIERARRLETREGWRTPDADLVLQLVINADGTAHSASSTMRTSADHLCPVLEARCNDSPSLRLCIEAAVSRVKFPAGPEQLELEVLVGWSQGLRHVTPRVLGRRTGPRGTIDLD